MAGQGATGPQAPADFVDHLGALLVVADEGDEAAPLATGLRLGDVVQEGAEAQRGAAAQLVGQRLGEQRLDLGGALAGEALEVGLDLERLLEHRDRVAVDVEVVVGPLLDAAQGRDLGQDDLGDAERVEQFEAAQRVGPAEQAAQLRQLPLAGGLAARPASARARASVSGSISAPERQPAGRRAAAAAGRRRSCDRRPPAGPAAPGRRGRRGDPSARRRAAAPRWRRR